MPNEKLEFASFERLNELMKVTDPKGWFALFAALFLVLCILIWLFIGSVPTKINGQGMLINVGGIETITANVSGRITKFNINVGDKIIFDQPIAFISQIPLQNEINNAKQKVDEQIITNQEKEDLRKQLEIKYKEEIVALNKKLEAQEKLLKSGLVIEKDALETKEKITETEKILEDLKIIRLNDTYLLNGLKRELLSLQSKYDRDSVVRSVYNGNVIELEATVGDVISPGSALLTMESTDDKLNKLKGIIYISAFDGKKVTPGMLVSITPANVKPEEYGSMMGKIESVSSYPATFKGIMQILHNEEVVKQILVSGSQVEVRVDLISNENTFSQYKWTTRNGPPIKIQSGTLCNAKITISDKKPIELIVPKIKSVLGIE